jgi:hypothetical protein
MRGVSTWRARANRHDHSGVVSCGGAGALWRSRREAGGSCAATRGLSGRREPGYPLDDVLCATTRASRSDSSRAGQGFAAEQDADPTQIGEQSS